jgi:hypothetical protein
VAIASAPVFLGAVVHGAMAREVRAKLHVQRLSSVSTTVSRLTFSRTILVISLSVTASILELRAAPPRSRSATADVCLVDFRGGTRTAHGRKLPAGMTDAILFGILRRFSDEPAPSIQKQH